MKTEEIKTAIQEIVVKAAYGQQTIIPASDVKPDENLRAPENTLGLDSLDVADIIAQVEEQFEIEITPREAAGLASVNDFVRYIER